MYEEVTLIWGHLSWGSTVVNEPTASQLPVSKVPTRITPPLRYQSRQMTPGNGCGQQDSKRAPPWLAGAFPRSLLPVSAPFNSHKSFLVASASPAARDLPREDAPPGLCSERKRRAGKPPAAPDTADFVSLNSGPFFLLSLLKSV